MEDTLLQQCFELYNAMEETADDTYGGLPLWEGFLTQLLDDIGLGREKYGRIVRLLQDMGCIDQVKRGAGGSPSRWVLAYAPTVDAFHAAKEAPAKNKQRAVDPIEQRLKDLQTVVINLADRVKALEWYVSTQDQNLSNLEEQSQSPSPTPPPHQEPSTSQ